MKPSEAKQEYRLQQWGGMIREQQESGLTIKQWCTECGVTENAFYYRLRKLRQMACSTLSKAQPIQIAQIPLAPSVPSGLQLQVKLPGGTVDISGADSAALEQILRVLMYADQRNGI